MKNIKGKVFDNLNNPVYGAKVFLSDISGNITPSKIGSLTDFNGEFSLNIPDNNNENYLTATSIQGGRNTQRYNSNIVNYVFDLGTAHTQNLQEVTITADRKVEKQQATKSTPKKKYWWLIPTVIGVLLIGGGVYYAVKLKTNK